MAKRRLGRGLGALLGKHAAEASASEQILKVALDRIQPNPWQPRESTPDDALVPLVESIRANGVLQPIVLRTHDDGYEIVAGERRWRAARKAGLSEIPAVVREVPNDQMLLLALLENVIREDLNAIERAQGYASLMVDLGWTQEQLAAQVGEARATIANTVRLLDLPDDIRDLVSRGTLTAGHARALLSLRDPHAQRRLCERVIREGLSVRQTEQLAAGVSAPSRSAPAKTVAPHIRVLEERLELALAARVTIKERKKGGRITIDFATHDDFERILAHLEGPDEPPASADGFHV